MKDVISTALLGLCVALVVSNAGQARGQEVTEEAQRPAPGKGLLAVRAVWTCCDAPAGGVVLYVRRDREGSPRAGLGASRHRIRLGPLGVSELMPLDPGFVGIQGTVGADGKRVKPGEFLGTGEIRAGETLEVCVGIDSVKTIRGRVVDTDGRPIAGAVIYTSWNPYTEPFRPAVVAGEDGAFRLRLATRTVWYAVAAPGFAGSRAFRAWKEPDVLESAKVRLCGPGRVLHGRIRNPEGEGVRGVRVSARPAGSQEEHGWTISDRDGQFKLVGVPLGKVEVRLSRQGPKKYGSTVKTMEVEVGARDPELLEVEWAIE